MDNALASDTESTPALGAQEGLSTGDILRAEVASLEATARAAAEDLSDGRARLHEIEEQEREAARLASGLRAYSLLGERTEQARVLGESLGAALAALRTIDGLERAACEALRAALPRDDARPLEWPNLRPALSDTETERLRLLLARRVLPSLDYDPDAEALRLVFVRSGIAPTHSTEATDVPCPAAAGPIPTE